MHRHTQSQAHTQTTQTRTFERMATELIRTTFDDRHQRVNSAMNNNSKREIATGMDDLIQMINDGNDGNDGNYYCAVIQFLRAERTI